MQAFSVKQEEYDGGVVALGKIKGTLGYKNHL